MSYTIKHMGLGGILDQAIAIVREHFVLLFTIMLFVLIPFLLIQNSLQVAVTTPAPKDATMQEVMRAHATQARYFPWFMGMNLIFLLIIIPIANAAVIQAIARLYLGQAVTATEAISHGVRRLLALLGTNILVGLAIVGGMLLCIVPGIYFAIWFGLAQNVVVLEGIAGPDAMKRSKRLVHRDRGTFLALLITLAVINGLLGAAAGFIPQPYLRVIGTVIIQTFTTMFWASALVVFYFSCRCNVENFDLHYLAETIRADSAGETPPSVPATP